MSCNGCRVLRKGCIEGCVLRPCLQWIKSPESQANATLFLAKFFGRAGLINLINAGPSHLRPEIFRSLLYEACGRIINPVYGSVGLMCSGNWSQCEFAVEAVLQGAPLMMRLDSATDARMLYPVLPLRGGYIRHLSKDTAASLHSARNRNCFSRSAAQAQSKVNSVESDMLRESDAKFTIMGWDSGEDYENFGEVMERAPSQDSSSVETVEPPLINRDELQVRGVKMNPGASCEIDLELTLGLNPVLHAYMPTVTEISGGETLRTQKTRFSGRRDHKLGS